MSERPYLAVVLSVAVHAAVIAGAATIPVRVAGGESAVGDGERVADEVDDAMEGGLYGNTFDIDGFVDGKLGDGAQDKRPTSGEVETTPEPVVQPEPKPVERPAPRPKSRKKKARKKKTRKGKRDAKPQAGSKSGVNDKGDGKSAPGDGDGGRQHGSKVAKPGQLSAAAAFAHAMAISFSNNSVWHDLPLGDAGTATVALRVDSGRVRKTDISENAPALLIKLASGAAAMTRIRKIQGEDGVTRVKMQVEILQKDVPRQEDVKGTTILVAKDRAPTKTKPGGVFYTFASGRHVRITITLL